MSKIRSKWTKPEIKIHNLLKGNRIRHTMHPEIEGGPDIVLKDRKVAVYLHGCFWHKCPKCFRMPRTRKRFWTEKIEKNLARDRKGMRAVKNAGYKTVVIWEHEIGKNFDVRRIVDV